MQKCTKQTIAEKVGISRSTGYRLIEKVESELEDCGNDLVQIVSIKSGIESNSSEENNQAPVNKLPELTLSNSGRINNQASDSLPDFTAEERTVDDTDTQVHRNAYQKYPPRQYYYRRSLCRDNRRQNQQWSTINLKGIRINFDLSICSTELINKLITVIKASRLCHFYHRPEE